MPLMLRLQSIFIEEGLPMDTSLGAIVDSCRIDAIRQGFWDEAESSSPPPDAEQLVILGDLVRAVGAAIDGQRKTGRIPSSHLEEIENATNLLRRVAFSARLPPYARVGGSGRREQTVTTPTNGIDGHVLRQLLHLVAEIGESLATLRAADYRMGEIDVEEVADIGIVWLDLAGAWGRRVVDALHHKRRKNRERPYGYGRAMSVVNVGPENETIYFGKLPISSGQTTVIDSWTLKTLAPECPGAVE